MADATTTNPLTTPRSIDELTNLAGSQIDSEVGAQEAPLNQQISDLQGRETNSLQKLGDMFGTLMPYVQGAAGAVQDSYNTAFQAQQSIFNTAMQRMNQMKQDRAQQAQTMAQEVGGPVAVGEFTASALAPSEELSMTAPNNLTHALANAEAGVQEANAFSGRVFPLVQTEQTANMKNFFETQISDLNKQVATLEGSKQGLKNTRLNDLLTQERQFQQSQAQLGLDKQKANRDWIATQHTLHNDDKRLSMAQTQYNRQFGLQTKAQTLEQQRINLQAKQQAARLKLDWSTLAERMRHDQETEKTQAARASARSQSNAMALVDKAMSPTHRGTLTLNTKSYIPKNSPAELAAASGTTKNAYWDPKKSQWYTYGKKTLTNAQALAQGYDLGGNTPVSDPQKLFTLLRSAGIPAATAIKVIRVKTGIGDFQPGKPTDYNAHTLAGMTNKDLMDLARARGYKGRGTRNVIINYIMSRNPASAPTPAGYGSTPSRP